MMSEREWQQAHRGTRYERVYGILLATGFWWPVKGLAKMERTDNGTMRAVLREGEALGHFERKPHPTRAGDLWRLSMAERGAGYVAE